MKDDLIFSLFLFFFVGICILSLFFATVLLYDNYNEIEDKNKIITDLKAENEFLLDSAQSNIIPPLEWKQSIDIFHFQENILFD